ncbi:MAG TPA: hypothetical protein VGE12_22985 [Noviherbaspirillum sp.]
MSYFSEKCRQCRFACLANSTPEQQKDQAPAGKSQTLSVLGSGAVIVGAAASLADYSTVAPELTIFGAIVVFANLVRG